MAISASAGIDQGRSRSTLRTTVSRTRWIGLLVIGLAGIFFYSVEQQHETFTAQAKKVRQPVTTELGLIAKRRGDDLLLLWNQNAPAITGATEGVLIVRAEDSIQRIVLTAGQLRSGSLFYVPTGDEINIGLEVKSAGHTLVEDAIIIPPTHESAQASRSFSTARSSEAIIQDRDKDVRPGTGSAALQPVSKLRLWSKGSVVMLAREESVAAELRENPSMMGRLIRDGSLFTVVVGTAVAARQMESRLVKVRIMEGVNAGQEGWVDISQLRTK